MDGSHDIFHVFVHFCFHVFLDRIHFSVHIVDLGREDFVRHDLVKLKSIELVDHEPDPADPLVRFRAGGKFFTGDVDEMQVNEVVLASFPGHEHADFVDHFCLGSAIGGVNSGLYIVIGI